MWRRLPSLVLVCFTVGVLVISVEPSQNRQIWLYSYLKFGFLCACFSMLFFFLVSLWWPRLARWNRNLMLVGLAVLIPLELWIRFFPERVPHRFWVLLPAGERRAAAASQGLFVTEKLRGEGLLYAYRPNLKEAALPWLEIDGRGYRNPENDTDTYDVVLLGDSLLVATGVREDLGARFRQAGFTALNLGFGGYGPNQYLAVYRKHIIQTGKKHRWLVVQISLSNDFTDARRYQQVRERGGDWQDYLGRHEAPAIARDWNAVWIPRVAVVLKRLPYLRYQASGGPVVQVSLPHGDFQIPEAMFGFAFSEQGAEWTAFSVAIGELLNQARISETRVILAMTPTNGMLFAPFTTDANELVLNLEHEQRQTIAAIRKRFQSPEVSILDLTPALRQGLENGPVTLAPRDNHLNDAGVDIIFQEIRKIIEGQTNE